MPAERANTPTPRRLRHRLAPLVALVVVVTSAACTSGTSGITGSTTPTPSQPLAPWVGSFINVAVPSGVHSLKDVTCPTAPRCWAVGSTLASANVASTAAVVASIDGGRSWVVQAVPAAVTYLSDIACTGARTCTAVGQAGTAGDGPGAIISTTNGGTTWTMQSVPTGTTDVTAVACSVVGHCTALADIDGRVTSLTLTGITSTWVAGGALPATVSAATAESCTDAAHCWATGTSPVDVGHAVGVVAATIDGGVTWALQTVPSGTGALQGISCTQQRTAGASSSATTSTSTSTSTSPSTSTTTSTSTAACTAVGTTTTALGGNRTGQGVVLTTSNGGTAWVSATVTSTSADLLAVSCNNGPCVAVGTTVASATQAGIIVLARSATASAATWRRAAIATVALPLAGVSCLTLASCVVVGDSITAHLIAQSSAG